MPHSSANSNPKEWISVVVKGNPAFANRLICLARSNSSSVVNIWGKSLPPERWSNRQVRAPGLIDRMSPLVCGMPQ